MTEPGSVQTGSVEADARLGQANPASIAVSVSTTTQLQLDWGDDSNCEIAWSGAVPSAAEPNHTEMLPGEVVELRSLSHKQGERIHHLEQALDQSLASLEELRVQLVEQQFLENQLASTEDIANIQQRAITQLKQQIAQQQQAIEAQQVQTHQQTRLFQEVLDTMEDLAEGQQTRLQQLKAKTRLEQFKAQAYAHHLDRASHSHPAPQPTTTAAPAAPNPDEIQELTLRLLDRQTTVDQLETELHRAQAMLQEQQALIDNQLKQAAPPSSDSPLDNELFTAHCRIQDLETQISKQITHHAILQHTCQELEQARDRYQTRATELEQQAADMQEQILKQAQQANEYETAVQHWRERYLKNQDYLKRLKTLVEQLLPNPPLELIDLLAAVQMIAEIPDPASSTAIAARSNKMDIPDFLARRQRYRARS